VVKGKFYRKIEGLATSRISSRPPPASFLLIFTAKQLLDVSIAKIFGVVVFIREAAVTPDQEPENAAKEVQGAIPELPASRVIFVLEKDTHRSEPLEHADAERSN
jgi:hypothetical protein